MLKFEDVCAFALLIFLSAFTGCGREQPLKSTPERMSGTALSRPAGKTASAGRTRVGVMVTRDGVPAGGVEVAFARSIAGQPVEFKWKGMTDADGWAEIALTVDSEQFWRIGTSGYYVARAMDPASGETVGQWGSLPIDGERDNFFAMPVGGPAEAHSASLKDKGNYVLEADPDSLVSYSGGGGLFVLSLVPGQTFDGKVVLSLVADPRLNAELRTTILTRNNPVTDVTIRPDTLTPPTIFNIAVLALHAGVADTIHLGVSTLVDASPWGELEDKGGTYAALRREEFVEWLQSAHPELGIRVGQDWFGYNRQPGNWEGDLYVGGGIWVFLNPIWEMQIRSIVIPRSPFWMLLRKRDEREPTLAAKKDSEGTIFEISIDEFNRW